MEDSFIIASLKLLKLKIERLEYATGLRFVSGRGGENFKHLQKLEKEIAELEKYNAL